MDHCAKPLVYVVDDDAGFRESLVWLLRSADLDVADCAGAGEFLARHEPDRPGCLLLDLRMPGLGGLEVQRLLGARQRFLPIIFVTAHGDVAVAVHAIRDGAFDFLQKPLCRQTLLERIGRAVAASAVAIREERARQEMRAAVTRLSDGERRVWAMAAIGLRDKAIADRLGLSVRTVEVRKRNARAKLGARSAAELARLSVLAGGVDDVADGSQPEPPTAARRVEAHRG